MATIPTSNPVPSEAAKDLKFNSGKIDELVNSDNDSFADRFNKARLTWKGIENISREAIAASGFVFVRSFEDGATIASPNQALLYESDGEYYRWNGSLPKVVPPSSTPDSSGGVGNNGWVGVGDASLRSALASPDGSELISYKLDTSSTSTFSRDVRDVLSESVYIDDFYSISDGNDYGIALGRAFLYFQNHSIATINFSARDYQFNTPAAYNGVANITLRGQSGTTLHLSSTSSVANISITSVRRITLQDIEVVVVEPSASATKVGFYLNCTGQDASHNLVSVRGTATISKASTGIVFFDIVNPSLSNFSSCYVRYFGSFALSDSSNNIAFRLTATTKISTDSRFDNCAVINCEIPYLVNPPNGTSGFLEGIAWNNCTIVNCMYGPFIQGDNSQPYRSPMYRWIGGHIFAYKTCINAYWISQLIIDSAIFYIVYDPSLSGVQGKFAVTLNETVTTQISNLIVRIVDAPNDGTSRAVHVGANCNFTSVNSLVAYSSSQSSAVVSVPGSRYTRVFNATVVYSGTPPTSAIGLGGTSDVDLGGNGVYPA